MLADLVRRRLTHLLRANDLRIDCAYERSIVQHRDELIAASRVTRESHVRYRTAA